MGKKGKDFAGISLYFHQQRMNDIHHPLVRIL
jgi:hypothetical protein